MGHDEGIKKRDPEKATGPREPVCYVDIGVRRLEVTRGMIVAKDDGLRVREDRGFEHFSDVDLRRIEGADGHDVHRRDLMGVIEKENDSVLAVTVADQLH